jgi:hypothetical protein
MFDVKVSYDTQLTFGSLTFTIKEDENLKMLSPGPTPEHLPLASWSVSSGSCSWSNLYAGSYIRIAKIVWGITVVTSILWPLAGTSSPSASALIPDPDSSNDHPEIGASTYGELGAGGRLIYMVAPNDDQ